MRQRTLKKISLNSFCVDYLLLGMGPDLSMACILNETHWRICIFFLCQWLSIAESSRVRDGGLYLLHVSAGTPCGFDQGKPSACCRSLDCRPFNPDSSQNPTILHSHWDFGLSHGQRSEPRTSWESWVDVLLLLYAGAEQAVLLTTGVFFWGLRRYLDGATCLGSSFRSCVRGPLFRWQPKVRENSAKAQTEAPAGCSPALQLSH